MTEKLDEVSGFLRRSALDAGAWLVTQRRAMRIVGDKGRDGLVTSADQGAAQLILNRLAQAYPGHDVLCEDAPPSALSRASRYLWYVDPLDGTTNYASGHPAYCVSIACYDTWEAVFLASAVYAPSLSLFFEASTAGACLNGASAVVGDNADSSRALILTGLSHKVEPGCHELEVFRLMSCATAGTRRSGCASLDMCFVGAGFADAYYHLNLKPWDIAAGAHFVQMAGGRVTTVVGSQLSLTEGTVLASNGRCHAGVQAQLRMAFGAPTIDAVA